MNKTKCYLFLSVVLLGCAMMSTGSAALGAELPPKIVNIAFSSAMGNIDPHNSSQNGSTNARASVFDALVYDDRAGHITPLLAERWESNETGDRWRFFLRKGVKFHNGEPFDAKDVKCTFDRLKANTSKLRTAVAYWKTLTNCEIVDDYTVDLVFDAPNPYCLNNASNTAIIPDEAYAKHGDDLWNKQLMYGTGPWVYKEWVEGQYVRLVKNPDYWNKDKYDSYYDELYLRMILEPATAVAAHLTGDIQANLPQGGVNKEFAEMYAGAADRIGKVGRETSTIFYFTMQCEEGKVFNDKNARMALEYCIDRKSIVDNVLDGEAEVTSSVIPKNVLGFDPNLPPYEYNPEKAREFLKKSNYDGRKISLMTFNGLKKGEEVLLAVADYMRTVGFDTSVEVIDYPLFLERRISGNYDLFYQLTQHPNNEASETLSLRFTLPGEGHHYNHPEMQELIAKVMREMDPAKRASYVSRVSHIMREEAAPATVISTIIQNYYVDRNVKGIAIFSDGAVRITYVDYDPTAK